MVCSRMTPSGSFIITPINVKQVSASPLRCLALTKARVCEGRLLFDLCITPIGGTNNDTHDIFSAYCSYFEKSYI